MVGPQNQAHAASPIKAAKKARSFVSVSAPSASKLAAAQPQSQERLGRARPARRAVRSGGGGASRPLIVVDPTWCPGSGIALYDNGLCLIAFTPPPPTADRPRSRLRKHSGTSPGSWRRRRRPRSANHPLKALFARRDRHMMWSRQGGK
jgi:hypothetical protein